MKKKARCILTVLTAAAWSLSVISAGCHTQRNADTDVSAQETSGFATTDTTASPFSTSSSPLNTTASQPSTAATLSMSDADALYSSNLGKIQSKLLARTTENTFTASGSRIEFSFENGKYKNCLPGEWAGKAINNKHNFFPYGFSVSPAKTAVVCKEDNQIVIVYSSDRGKTWQKSTVNTTFSQFDYAKYGRTGNSYPADTFVYAFIDFPTADCGYAVLGEDTEMNANDKFVLKTADGGKTWSYLAFLQRDDPQSGMTFISNKVGYIVETCLAINEGDVSKTTDGGATWTDFRFCFNDKFNYSDWQSYVFAPYFKNNKGYLPIYLFNRNTAADKIIYYVSTDNGGTWQYDSYLDSADLQ